MRRSLALSSLLVVGLLGVPALAAETDDLAATVTIVTRTANGSLAFRSERVARSQASGRALRWRQMGGVVAADVDHRIQISGDPLRSEQWGLTTLRASEVQAAGDARGQVIAVIDSGVDATHPDLKSVVLPGTDLVAAGDGRTDPNGHGTHVAGIAAAVGDNAVGGAGLANGAQVLPVRVIGADGSGTVGNAARGVVWAADHGATVINLSFGGPDRSGVMDAAISYALGRGVAVVAASGNEGQNGDPVMYPAAIPGVIAVAAVDRAGARPSWSGTGDHVALSAPGVGILSTTAGGGYASWSGTSMATPFVSAAVALLRKANPVLGVAAVRDRLTGTADDLGPAGQDRQFGYGRVAPYAALGLTPAPPPAPAPAPAQPAAEQPAPAPSTSPAPALAPAASSPTLVGVRISSDRTTVAYRSVVRVATRTMADGAVAAGVPVRLERVVAGRWVLTRTGTTGSNGLAAWDLRPDVTTYYRVRAGGLISPLRVIVVRR